MKKIRLTSVRVLRSVRPRYAKNDRNSKRAKTYKAKMYSDGFGDDWESMRVIESAVENWEKNFEYSTCTRGRTMTSNCNRTLRREKLYEKYSIFFCGGCRREKKNLGFSQRSVARARAVFHLTSFIINRNEVYIRRSRRRTMVTIWSITRTQYSI